MNIKYTAEPTAQLFHADNSFVRGIMGPVGCTDTDTEYLSPTGWKRIGDYDGGEVAQWDTDGRISFVYPDYVEGPCKEMILFENANSISMCVSPNHRMPLYQFDGKFVVKTAETVEAKPSRHRVPVNFTPSNTVNSLTDAEVRLRVMIAADGHYPTTGNQCIITVRKDRKKDRVRELLAVNGIEWTEGVNEKRPTEVRFVFARPSFPKPLHESHNWYTATQHEFSILIDEMSHWDGLYNHEEVRFYTDKKEEADVIQFAAHAIGRISHIRWQDYREELWVKTYVVSVSRASSRRGVVGLRGDNVEIKRVKPRNGRQYCFTVPTSFWVARRDNKIFITGNSGKSVACTIEVVARALKQTPAPDGIRYSRWAAIRNTYPELKSTLIKTWEDWIPPTICPVKWDTPITARLKITDIGDGTGIDLEVIFLALDKPQDVKKLLSLELTGGWINEAKEVDPAVLTMLTSRVGRYPSKAKMGGASYWSGIIMDTNPMDEDHWYYRLAEEDRPQGYRFYRQPGALIYTTSKKYIPNPTAENINNLPNGHDYYMRQVGGKDHEWIKVYLMGEYGAVMDGKPVYPEYSDLSHCPDVEVKPLERSPLIVSFDFGLTPCCIIGQLSPRGQLVIIDELVSDNMGIRQFANEIVVPYLSSHYPKFSIHCTGDPAGVQRAQSNESTCMDELKDAGLPTEPAWTNEFIARREAVAGFLNKMVDGQPAFVLSHKCRMLRKGFLGGYCYKRTQVSGGRYKDKPDKNEYSHPHDALQYLALYLTEQRSRALKSSARRHSATTYKSAPMDDVAGY